MNTMSNTSMTSTNGVTLISLMTARRRRLPRGRPTPRSTTFAAIALTPHPRSSICRDRIAVNSSANPSRRCACRFTSVMNLL